ncbi:MAG: carbonic anhydrase [Actinophytocola sp.]|nr:carbonic anhydrase [Actinophytocola sp.]
MGDNSVQSNRLTRRRALGAGALAATAGIAGVPAATAAPPPGRMHPAHAWRRLVEGNERFVAARQRHPHEGLPWRETLVDGQEPFACVLGCADSRVPPELIFDQGLGDLFTVRTAGEVLDESIIGSIEYAVAHLHVPLVVVLGHESCGAVTAAVDLFRSGHGGTGSISTLVRGIEASVLRTPKDDDADAFLAACIVTQARRVITQLRERSELIRDAVDSHRLGLVPAVYDLDEYRVQRH